MAARLNITLDEKSMNAMNYLTKEYSKNKSQIIMQALMNFQEQTQKEKRKSMWSKGLKEANLDKKYIKEQKELSNVGSDDGID